MIDDVIPNFGANATKITVHKSVCHKQHVHYTCYMRCNQLSCVEALVVNNSQ